MNLWSHIFTQSINQILYEFLPCTVPHYRAEILTIFGSYFGSSWIDTTCIFKICLYFKQSLLLFSWWHKYCHQEKKNSTDYHGPRDKIVKKNPKEIKDYQYGRKVLNRNHAPFHHHNLRNMIVKSANLRSSLVYYILKEINRKTIPAI